ncbi:MAG TPA: bifunctional 4-hydroxy-2-oxoglutarate aldolase/2-dehydro-3-deoxy-phosphogluconate aldolase [Acidimicrobiales bacterium]|nr:bifunctional 4-hydroxy-2-oxoglutarate aldolase/2-dehydro-3-deoxy-phosphogluconate aldolase [Acidimicrobiales bacterium]
MVAARSGPAGFEPGESRPAGGGSVPPGLVAVVRAASAGECLTVVRGLRTAGIGVVEVTFTVPGAPEVIAELTAAPSPLVVGAGTVLDVAQCVAAIEAGASFVVSPVTDRDVLEEAHSGGVAYVGGALSPTEVVAAMRLGADAVKIFPIGAVGGPSYLRALLEPLPSLRAVASGGIRPEEASAYREAGAHAWCMGGTLIDRRAALAGDEGAVAEHARGVLSAIGAGIA